MTDTSTSPELAPPGGRGVFLVLEGPDGAGKSTQIERLQRRFEARGRTVLRVREPGGTGLGEAVRGLLLDPKGTTGGTLDRTTELFLFLASRAQLCAEVIRPALARGDVVLADRFYASTAVYQGYADQTMPVGEVIQLSLAATGQLMPDLTIVLSIDAATVEARTLSREGQLNHLDLRGRAYFERVVAGYSVFAAEAPETVAVIDASGSRDEVAAAVIGALAPHLDALDHP